MSRGLHCAPRVWIVCNWIGCILVDRDGGPVATDHIEQDPAVRALGELMTVLDSCTAELGGARQRAEKLLEERETGRAWLDIVTAESRPLGGGEISPGVAARAAPGRAAAGRG